MNGSSGTGAFEPGVYNYSYSAATIAAARELGFTAIRIMINIETAGHPVRQLRHHFGPSLRDVWALYHPTHAVHCALLGYHAYWMRIGACDPML